MSAAALIRRLTTFLGVSLWASVVASAAPGTGIPAAAPWVNGSHYQTLPTPVATDLPRGKIEVTEVFSYGCPACNRFAPTMRQIARSMPKNVVVTYTPASWIKAEAWPMFQQAYLTAKSLGVADRAHDAMYDAIWQLGGELAITDSLTGRVKRQLPTIEDAAKFYQRMTGVPAAKFVASANSFGVAREMQRADERIKKLQADSTPTIVVNGKYLTNPAMAGGEQQLVALVQWLVRQEAKPSPKR